MQPILDRILSRLVTQGSLRVTYPDGLTRTYGGQPGPEAADAAPRSGNHTGARHQPRPCLR